MSLLRAVTQANVGFFFNIVAALEVTLTHTPASNSNKLIGLSSWS